MKNRLKTLLRLALIAALLAPTGAQAAYEDLGVGARATGMGNAFTAVADDVYSIYYNPAGLGTLDRPELATSYSKLFTGLSDNSNLQNSFAAYAQPLKEGRQGTLGLGWSYFSLDSLYQETMLFGSYGRELFPESMPNKLYAGASLKYLDRSIGGTGVAGSALGPTGIATGTPDPVLQHTSKSNEDVDLGVLYRVRPRWTLGLVIQHATQPNIAFSKDDTDPLRRNVKLGGAYKTPFSTLSTDLDLRAAPDGSTDKIVTVGAEKWLPTLVHGSFGVRGSLGLGSRDYRQVTAGVSYKIYRMQFDYGFGIPVGGLAAGSGTHRMGITFRFGRPRQAEPAYAEAVLENMQELARFGSPELRYQAADLALYKRTAIEEFLRQAKVDLGNARFADALEKVDQAQALNPADELMRASQERLKLSSGFYPAVSDFRAEPAQAAIYEGIMEFLSGHDRDAVAKLSYASTLNPGDQKLKDLIKAISESRPAAAAAAAPVPAPQPAAQDKGVGGDMALMEVALREREYDKVVALASQVIERDPSNSLAYMRMGTAYYNLGKYAQALGALRSAYRVETDPEFRKTLRAYINALRALTEKPVEAPAPAPAISELKPAMTPQQIERLYESGVDLYAQGQYAEAANLFRRILDADPTNVSARRALERVQAELIDIQKEARPQ